VGVVHFEYYYEELQHHHCTIAMLTWSWHDIRSKLLSASLLQECAKQFTTLINVHECHDTDVADPSK